MKDYIVHSGILGMKWGVRRFQNKDGSLTPAGKKRYSEKQFKKQENIGETKNKYPDVKTLSDDDIRRIVQRIKAEKEYIDLTTPRQKKSAIKQYGEDFISKFGDQLIDTTAKSSARTVGAKIIKGIFGDDAIIDKPKK